MTHRLLCLVALALVGCGPAETRAQATDTAPAPATKPGDRLAASDLLGSWRGAYIQNRGTLSVDMDIRSDGDGGLLAVQRVPDWIGYAPMQPAPIVLGPDGSVEIPDALRGGLRLQFDPVYRQLVGETGTGLSAHFKRALPPLPSRSVAEEVRIPAGDVSLAGTLTRPDGPGPHPAMVVISGRGCWGRGRSIGRVLPDYGMAVLEYDKRGTGDSTGACDRATFDDLVDDAVAAMTYLRAQPGIDPARVGLQGGSAGAWTAQGVAGRALDDPDLDLPAFIVTFIGPATSIEMQQRESGEAIADQLGLDAPSRAAVMRSVDITLDRSLPNEAVFEELAAIAAAAEAAGWKNQMFDPSDIPASPEAVDALWLRRFVFDPTPILRRLTDTPYLSLLGAEDAIVPLPSNADALRDALDAAGNTAYAVVVIPGTGHGVEHGDREATLPDGATYTKFDTVEPLYFTAMIDFLREQGVLD